MCDVAPTAAPMIEAYVSILIFVLLIKSYKVRVFLLESHDFVRLDPLCKLSVKLDELLTVVLMDDWQVLLNPIPHCWILSMVVLLNVVGALALRLMILFASCIHVAIKLLPHYLHIETVCVMRVLAAANRIHLIIGLIKVV